MDFALAGFIVVFAMAALAGKFGWRAVKRMIGSAAVVDIAATLIFIWIFAFTGTISGLMTGLWAGLILSIILYFLQGLLPHEKLEKGRWVEKPAAWIEAGKSAWHTKVEPHLQGARVST